MPANLTPQYLEAERRYKQATTPASKLEALEEMLAIIPKHKGTEKLQAELKSRLSKLRAESQKSQGLAGRRSSLDYVEREGCGQVVLLGAPNSGKSSLLARLTHATPEIAAYPYTTRVPIPGMMPFENVQIQLVDLPPISQEFWEPRLLGAIRNADAALLLADLSASDMIEQVEVVFTLLAKSKISLLQKNYSLKDTPISGVAKPARLVGAKNDLDPHRESLQILAELYSHEFSVISLSTITDTNPVDIKTQIYDMLNIIRVYSKPPGKKADLSDPFVLRKGSTVLEAATGIHKDFAEKLKFARIWGSEKFQGQMVHRDHILKDGDIIEFHI